MASKWAQLDREHTDDESHAWSMLHEFDDTSVDDNASSWARAASTSSVRPSSSAAGWAALGQFSDDSGDDQPIDVPDVAVVELPSSEQIEQSIAMINANTTLAQLDSTVRSLVTYLDNASSLTDLNWCAKLFDDILSKVAESGARQSFLDSHVEKSTAFETFANEQVASTDPKNATPIESHRAEAKRLGVHAQTLSRRRALGAVATVVFQRECADDFMALMCRKVVANGGTPETYFEKHRGDETPYAKVSAKDVSCETDDKIGDVADDGVSADVPIPIGCLVAVPNSNAQVGKCVENISANLKVYQTDVEVAGLFILDDSELLVSFKLIAPLTRVDRCTGRNYADLHRRQCNLLESRRLFKRCQRLHTSDGDKAQSLAERVLETRLKADARCSVPTLRSQCQVHRVFHCLTAGMRLFANFITGQIKMALSLRGPGNFSKFKEVLWVWLLANHAYVFEDNPLGAGEAADRHRKGIYGVYFPSVRGRQQRRNRLKFWIVYRLPNGDIRMPNVFQHFCKAGCCKGVKDFIRKLKWFVAVVAGVVCKVAQRSR